MSPVGVLGTLGESDVKTMVRQLTEGLPTAAANLDMYGLLRMILLVHL